jgi:4-aminobutyrate aminotransferase-like enzyme/Ser/Thr protein kinase RdoA (MazF antagonist)
MIRIQDLPNIDEAEALAAVRKHYALEGTLSPLSGDRDRNFLVETAEGERYVVKATSPDEPQDILDFETRMMGGLSRETDGLVPGLVPAMDGSHQVEHTGADGTVHRIRVFEFLPGSTLAVANPRSLDLLEDLGRRLAVLDSALGAVPDHPPARVGFDWALGHAGDVMARGLALLDGEQHALVERAIASFRAQEPDFFGLGSQVIHGDVNDHNVLVSDGGAEPRRVTGIIDLGDAHSAPRVFDLAIAIAYAILDTPDAMASAAAIAQGYHREHSLLEQEADVIMTLVRARLGQSVCISAWRRAHGGADAYHLISERPAWDMLRTLDAIPGTLATGMLRSACGLEAARGSAELTAWLKTKSFSAVMQRPEDGRAVGVLDLSVSSLDLNGRDTDDTEDFTRRVFDRMGADGITLGVGRYLEPRGFYLTDEFKGRVGDPRERRTIHLGIDLFDEAGAMVFAPLVGRVKTVRDNDGRLDYGPTVILEHDGPRGPFWTLYGHLQRTSVGNLAVGDPVEAGQIIGRIGPHPENGDWPPHLHFQIMTDLLGFDGEFPGVALPREEAVWASFSPDPNLILRLPGRTTYTSPVGVHARRNDLLGPSLSLSYDEPIHVVRGRGTYLYDVSGREYLDCVNNVAHVGHEHPAVVLAGQRQMGVLNTNTRYLHERVLEYAERLTATLPEPLSVCFFVNSGSEANELALRMARAHSGGHGIVTIEGGYHGNTQALVDVSHYKHAGSGGAGAPDWVETVPLPDEYRGRYRSQDPFRAQRYADHVGEAFSALTARGFAPAAFLAESILSCGGQIEPPAGYMAAAYAHARAAGALCIADEVQIGFGRVGSHMWAFETQDVVPDIVTLGKPIGNGHPLGAVVTTAEVAASFNNGMEYFSTFGGNPVSAAIGRSVLDVLEREGLQASAAAVGERLKAGLRELSARHAMIGDVRGRGLFLGIEFVRPGDPPQPHAEVASYVVNRLKQRGILLSTDGPDHNVIKIKPPMTFSAADADRVVREIDAVLGHDIIGTLGAQRTSVTDTRQT